MEKSNKVLVTGILSVVAVLSMLAFSSAANASMWNGMMYPDDSSAGSNTPSTSYTGDDTASYPVNGGTGLMGYWNMYKDSDGFYVRLGVDGIALKVSDWFFVKKDDGTYAKFSDTHYVKIEDNSGREGSMYAEMLGNRMFRLDDGTLLFRQGNYLYKPDGTSMRITDWNFVKTADGSFVKETSGIFVKTVNGIFVQVYPSPKIVPMPLSTTAQPGAGME